MLRKHKYEFAAAGEVRFQGWRHPMEKQNQQDGKTPHGIEFGHVGTDQRRVGNRIAGSVGGRRAFSELRHNYREISRMETATQVKLRGLLKVVNSGPYYRPGDSSNFLSF
jgi:hypothetical protein